MSADYGYLNARVRGLRSRLLPPGFMAEQLDSPGFAGFTTALAQTTYGRDLEEAQAEGSGLSAVDTALARSFVRTTRGLLRQADGRPRELIALLLRRYDLANLKSVVRARHAGRDGEDVLAAVLPAGELDMPVLKAMAEAPDLPSAAQVLALSGHRLTEAFRKAAAAYASDQDLLVFEVALDQAFYQGLIADAEELGAPPAFQRYVANEVDAANLRTALKLRGREGDPRRFFVPGGRAVGLQLFTELAGQPQGTPLPQLRPPFTELADATSLGEVESRLRSAQDVQAGRLATDPLDIGLVTQYLLRKEQETAQLRLLARGKYYGVPREALAKEMGDA